MRANGETMSLRLTNCGFHCLRITRVATASDVHGGNPVHHGFLRTVSDSFRHFPHVTVQIDALHWRINSGEERYSSSLKSSARAFSKLTNSKRTSWWACN